MRERKGEISNQALEFGIDQNLSMNLKSWIYFVRESFTNGRVLISAIIQAKREAAHIKSE